MLLNGSVLEKLPVGSIRDSGRIGFVNKLIVNPNNLHVDGFSCRIGGQNGQIVTNTDIRNLTPRGLVIDDHDRLIEENDAVRLQPIINLDFKLVGLVAFVGNKKVGVVEDFAVDSGGLFIQRIYVRPRLLNLWSTSRLSFGRQQVQEVTPKKIVFIDSSQQKASVPLRERVKKPVPQASLSASTTRE